MDVSRASVGRSKRGQGTSKSAFDIVIDRTLKASRNGVPYEVTVEEALQYRTYQQALAGKPHGNPGSYGWIQKREQWLD